jgi:VWFA-related protein
MGMITMKHLPSFLVRMVLLNALFASGVRVPAVSAQAPQPKPATQAEDVVRIKTELAQTDVTVLDKNNRFVGGLRADQFELSIDGKQQPISFFEQVTAGSAGEATQLQAVRGAPSSINAPTRVAPTGDQGRVVFFFLDDLHLSSASLIRARKALTEFVERQMSQYDRVAIVTASGQIGFLQQLTDYKPMLRAAIERIQYKKNAETYAGKVPISEYEAVQVADNNNRELFIYLVLSTMNEFQAKGALARVAANMVKNRVRTISAQQRMNTSDLLGVLESLMRSSASLPGRKLVFFISDGFVSNARGSNTLTVLQKITAAAAESGVVVYTMDARGSVYDAAVDAGRNDFPDGMATGRQARQPSLENWGLQEPLHILADETGGRAIIGSNSFRDAFRQAIDETSNYYLLAWRPDTDEQRRGKSKIKVTVKDRPDWRVRLRRNYYLPAPVAAKSPVAGEEAKPSAPETPEAGLLLALGAPYVRRGIPTSLAVGFVNTPGQGSVLKASMQIQRNDLDLSANGSQKSELDVVGAAVDDRGIIVTFKQVLTVTLDPTAKNQSQPVVWNQQLLVPPGLYQVRVAVRERSSGQTGSAQTWIEVPDVSGSRFQLSSLFLGERRSTAASDSPGVIPQPVLVDVDQRFSRTSVLRYQTYVYNAARGSQPPDVEMQARVIRDNRAILTMPAMPLPTDTAKDQSRLPYWAELPLQQLPPGRYALEVMAVDRATKTSTVQTASFVVE